MSDETQPGQGRRSGVLSGGAAVAFDRWRTTEFSAAAAGGRSAPGMSIAQLEALQKQAHEEAFAQGLIEGRRAGEAEAHAHARRFDALLAQLARPFDVLDECVEKQVVQLAMIVARNIIRRELKIDPSHVIGAVREALAVLPVAARDVRVKLHPDDAALVREFLKPAEGERAWHIVEDPVLTRGGCQVATEFSRVDARVESRLSALIATIVGDEREDPEAAPE